jgi:hypothetical protein
MSSVNVDPAAAPAQAGPSAAGRLQPGLARRLVPYGYLSPTILLSQS